MPSETILIIGGGPAGLEAARGIAELGYTTVLIEARERLDDYGAISQLGDPACRLEAGGTPADDEDRLAGHGFSWVSGRRGRRDRDGVPAATWRPHRPTS
jgi:2-polyprenyl-6-methoxyphenol hydroxylase-like FAD-dependent oxidoreductase